MNKQEALARTDKLRSVLERIPDGIEWLCPSLEGFTVSGENPSILLTADDEFSALADYFNAQPTRHDEYPSPDWYAMAFEVDGVTLYNIYKKGKKGGQRT